jgi:hypothetical protein
MLLPAAKFKNRSDGFQVFSHNYSGGAYLGKDFFVRQTTHACGEAIRQLLTVFPQIPFVCSNQAILQIIKQARRILLRRGRF